MTPLSRIADSRRALTILATLGVWLLALYALRYGYFEISPEQDPCLRDAASGACTLRAALGTTIHWQVFGLGGLGSAMLALLLQGTPRRRFAIVGLLVSAAALVLYNARYGAPAAALSVVALLGNTPEPAD